MDKIIYRGYRIPIVSGEPNEDIDTRNNVFVARKNIPGYDGSPAKIKVPFDFDAYEGRFVDQDLLDEIQCAMIEVANRVIDETLDSSKDSFINKMIKSVKKEKKIQTITICGSRRFREEMEEEKRRLERDFQIVHMPNFSFESEEFGDFTEEDFDLLHEQHYRKMMSSDWIYIVNPGGYVGSDTQREIDFAVSHGMEVRYMVEVNS